MEGCSGEVWEVESMGSLGGGGRRGREGWNGRKVGNGRVEKKGWAWLWNYRTHYAIRAL